MTASADLEDDQPDVVRRFGDTTAALAAVAAFHRAAAPPS
jgi:hypothetical protein